MHHYTCNASCGQTCLQGELEVGAAVELDLVVRISGGPKGDAERLVSSEVWYILSERQIL